MRGIYIITTPPWPAMSEVAIQRIEGAIYVTARAGELVRSTVIADVEEIAVFESGAHLYLRDGWHQWGPDANGVCFMSDGAKKRVMR
jgi:hypothetical protein